jgi:hypothetical protein
VVLPWLRLSNAGDFLQQPEERALADRRDCPVDRQRLEAVLEALADAAEVEVAPTRAAVDGGDEVVVGLVEVEDEWLDLFLTSTESGIPLQWQPTPCSMQ